MATRLDLEPQAPTDPAIMWTIHATCVVLFEAGVLIRGEPGSGKSTLALSLLDRATQAGIRTGLVGDDRVRLERRATALVARAHPALGDLIEIRGLGLRRVASHVDVATIRLIVDLVASLPRMPDAACDAACLLGIAVPRIMLDRNMIGGGIAPRLIFDSLSALGSVAAQTQWVPVLRDPVRGL